MRKSVVHLKDASSPLLSQQRQRQHKRPLTSISTCCWHSHLRDLLNCFGEQTMARSRLYKSRPYHPHQRSRFHYSSTSCAAIPTTTSLPNPPPTPTSTSNATTHLDTVDHSRSTDIPGSSTRLYGALAMFNFTDHIALSDLEEALRLQQAGKSWQLFCTLTNGVSDIGNNGNEDISGGNVSKQQELTGESRPSSTLTSTASSSTIDNDDDDDDRLMDVITVPYNHCTDLYSLLLYAQDLAAHPNVIAMRQQQLDRVATYVEQQLGQPKSTFINSIPRRIVPTYKLLQQALRHGHQQSAWKYYTQLLAEDPVGAPSAVTRNHYLKLLSLVVGTEKRYLNEQQRQDMVQLITTSHEGIPCQHGRILTAEAIEWIATIYSKYDHHQPNHGRRLVRDFLREGKSGSNKQPLASADTIDELIWRILPFDLKTAHMILKTMHHRGIPQNETTYCNLIKAFTADRQFDRALGVFEQMLTIGVTPTVPTFNAVLQMFADQGLTERAVYIWDTLHALDLEPDEATYSEIIRCFGRVGQLKTCRHYYHLMIQQQQMQQQYKQQQQQQQQDVSMIKVVSPNLYTYSTLIEAFGKRNDVRGVLRWFQTLLRQGLAPNEVIIGNVLKALGKHHYQDNMMEAVQRIANQCIMAGIKTDTTLFTLLLTLKSTATPPRRTRSSSTSGTTTASPPIQIEGNTDLAFVLQSHREMLAKCVEPNVYTYTALINLFGKHGYVVTAQQIFDLMQQSDHHRPTTVTYCAMIEVLRLANQQDQVDLLLYDFLVQSKSDRSQGKRLWVDAKLKHQFRCYHGC
ncbi:hypothetical protein [Absidia glauca]|uniref:PROP1-like PPR domain-containing protein n=1 Tax=Absidia glauca TaxID=4829 RepID=A0A163IZU0_ABSGL|nr:hypothetical protein [Absidia glauca]